VSPATVALAVSGHGFGHAVRCAEVARELSERGARIVIRSDAPRWLFPVQATWIPEQQWPLDVGVAQHDGLDLDVDETRRRWQAFARDFDAHAVVEADLLRHFGADVLVGDIPPLAFAAARRAKLPAFALGNFTWDWIYACWPDFEPIIERVQRGYSDATALLRLPLHPASADAFASFKAIEDVPLIARKAGRPRAEVRRDLGLDPDARVVLISFGGFGARALNLANLASCPRYQFVVTPPLTLDPAARPANVLTLNETVADYVSLVAACDVVVTKPGYGIVADCLANQVSVLFTDRGPFREYDVLARALPHLGRARYVPREDVLEGNLGPHLDALFTIAVGWTDQCMNGASQVAERVLREITVKQQSV
jgi:L-arabinokinase